MPKHAKTKDTCCSSTGDGPQRGKRVRLVPFARGFKQRDESARLNAIGFKISDIPKEFSCGLHGSSSLPSSTSSSNVFFNPIPRPTCEDDWLAQYNEDGQTYKQFLAENPWLSKRKIKFTKQRFCISGTYVKDKYPDGKVYVMQLGEFDHCIEFSDLVDYTSRFLCLPVEALPPLQLELTGSKVILVDNSSSSKGRNTRIKRCELHSRCDSDTGHVQLRVDSVLSKLRQQIPTDALCLIALTTLDLFSDSSDLFVAGMAAGNQRVAVFSLLRYDPGLVFSKEHWYHLSASPQRMAAAEKSRLLLQRSCKLVVHEVLHLFGVDHCVFFDCCMNGSGHLAEDFRQPMHLCPVDLRKLQTLVGFNVGDRYRSLLEFYRKHSLTVEAEWVQRRLAYLGC